MRMGLGLGIGLEASQRKSCPAEGNVALAIAARSKQMPAKMKATNDVAAAN